MKNFLIKISILALNKEVHKFANYYIFSIINAVVGIISISYLSKHIPLEDYGKIGIFTSILFFIPSLISFSANGLQAIEIINLDNIKYVTFRNTYISFVLLISIFCFIVAVFFSLYFKEFSFIILTASIMGFLQIFSTIHNTELIQYSQPTRFGLLTSLTILLSFILTYIFISKFNLDWKSRIYALLIAEFIFLAIRFYFLSSIATNFTFIVSKNEFKIFYLFGTPLLISIIPAWIQTQSDRYFMISYYSLKEAGLYSLAAGIASIIMIINANMIKVVYPIVYKKLNQKEGKNFIFKITTFYSIIILLITIIFCISIFLFNDLFLGKKYVKALDIIYIMCFSQAFTGIYMTTGLVIEYFKKTKIKMALVIFCALTVIFFSFLLMPFYGIYAPAIASLFSAIFSAVLSLTISKKLMSEHNIKA
jgi:O-antigen/teichoic acid export membrane protein